MTGLPVGMGTGMYGGAVALITIAFGAAGLILTIFGGLGLLYLRLTDSDLKPYTNLSHIFNLLFITIALVLIFIFWITADNDFSMLRGYVSSLITFDLSNSTESGLGNIAVSSCCAS